MKKKIISLCLVVLMVLFQLPLGVFAEEAGVTFEYTYNQNDYTATLTNGKSASGAVTIPDKVTYGGTDYSVTTIGNSAFSGCSALTSVTIPSSVTSIDIAAFWICSSLTTVSIPDSVTTIGYAAFAETGLTSVEIPSSVTSIGGSAFYGCSSLTSVNFGKNSALQTIGTGAFDSCSSLTSVNFGKNSALQTIGAAAFEETALTSVEIPSSVTSIGSTAFWECSSLGSVTIPSSVTSIGAGAFEGTALTSVTIPSSVTSIGEDAFDDTGLKDIYYGGTKEDWEKITIGKNAIPKEVTIHYAGSNPSPTVPIQFIPRMENFATTTGAFNDEAYYCRAARAGDVVLLKVSTSELGDQYGLNYKNLTVKYEVIGATQLGGNFDYNGDPVYKDGIATQFVLGSGFNSIVAHVYYNGVYCGAFAPFFANVAE